MGVKFVASFCLHCYSFNDLSTALCDLWAHTRAQPLELAKTCVPSALYTFQNNMLFVGLSNLSAGSYQVTNQLKILTTAALSVVILGTKLSAEKWGALVLLTAGVAVVNKSGKDANSDEAKQDSVIGLAAVICACFTSGLASVYLEKILKQTKTSLWLRNMQLSFFGSVFAIVVAFSKDRQAIVQDGFLQGYNLLVWAVVFCHAVGGLLVAVVMKYADNILKCFGCAIAIIFTSTLSVVVLQESTLDTYLVAGTFLVLVATVIYSLGLPRLERIQGLQHVWREDDGRPKRQDYIEVDLPPEVIGNSPPSPCTKPKCSPCEINGHTN